MMEAIARDEDEFDLQDGDLDAQALADIEKHKQYLLAQQYARQYQGLDLEDGEDLSEEQLMEALH